MFIMVFPSAFCLPYQSVTHTNFTPHFSMPRVLFVQSSVFNPQSAVRLPTAD